MNILTKLLKRSRRRVKPYPVLDTLKKDAAKLKSNLSSVDSAIATDLDGLITYWSVGAEQLFGYQKNEIIRKYISSLYFDEDHAFLEKNIFETLKSSTSGTHELTLRLRKKSGEPLYCRLKFSVLLSSSGKPCGMIGFVVDITEHMLEEQEKRVISDQKYQEIFNTVPVSIWEEDISELRLFFEKLKTQGVIDIENYLRDHPEVVTSAMRCIKVVDVNNYSAKLYRAASKRDLIDKSLAPLITEDSKKLFIYELVAIWNKEEIFAIETTNKTFDGDILYLSIVFRIPSVEDLDQSMLVCIQDLTENKFTENALRTSEEKYRSVVDATSEWIWEVDINRRIIYSNDTVNAILGYSTIDIFNTDLCEFMHKDDANRMKADWLNILDMKESWNNIERRWFDKDNKLHYLESTAFPVYDNEKKVIGYRGLERDVTEKKNNAELLIAAKKMAAAGELSARIAHEINNPLAGIKNSFQLIKRSLNPKYKDFKYVELIDKEIDRIAEIVRQMYGLYKENVNEIEYFDLKKVINEIIFLLKSDTDKKIKFEINVSDEASFLNYSEASFRQILFNFISNAVDAYDESGVIYINSTVKNDFFYLSVADNGRGIKKEDASRIFDPFFSTKKIPGKGLGLGLSTCKNIVELMGGEIECIPDKVYKTELRITLPYKD